MTDAITDFNNYGDCITNNLGRVSRKDYLDAYTQIKNTITNGARVFVCGNGGSSAIASHWATDFSKGVWHNSGWERPSRVIALGQNTAFSTAAANDYGYEYVFETELKVQCAMRDDLLICISSSGNSDNIIKAIEYCNSILMPTLSLTGFSGGKARGLSDINIHVNDSNYGRVEDTHHIIMHSLCHSIIKSLSLKPPEELVL
ncbi:MAG: SIS domain-containing protein [Proteobacteria bacterium]|nr:SIS domain-containing protein [Pseudomonadota bacterium]